LYHNCLSRGINCSGDGMFGSVKVKNRWVTVFSLLCAAVFVAVCFLMLRSTAPDTVEINGKDVPLGVSDDEDISAFLSLCGYDDMQVLSDKEITVPVIWNEVYAEYQELQESQGFDLVPYKGKSAREIVFDCGDEYLTLLISGEKIIAAHINSDDGVAKPLID